MGNQLSDKGMRIVGSVMCAIIVFLLLLMVFIAGIQFEKHQQFKREEITFINGGLYE